MRIATKAVSQCSDPWSVPTPKEEGFVSELHTRASAHRKGRPAWRVGLPAGVLACTAALAAPVSAGAAERLIGLGGINTLYSFSSQAPAAARSLPVSGLVAGDRLVGIDRRPLTGQIYGVSSAGRIYTLNPATGRAAAVAPTPFAPLPQGSSFGVDFNPVVDRTRFVSNTSQDLRLNQLDGTTAAVDGPLAYAPDDPNAGRNPTVEAVGYTNNVANAASTQLLDIDTTQDVLAEQNPPNDGVLRTRGALGVNALGPVGYDIAGSNGVGYATLRRAGRRTHEVFTVNSGSGRLGRPGRFNFLPLRGGLRGLTAIGRIPDDRTRPRRTTPNVRGVQSRSRVRSRGVQISGSCSEACVFVASVRLGLGGRIVGAAQGVGTRSGFRVLLNAEGRRALARGSRALNLTIRAYDAAGNRGSLTRRSVVVR